MGLVRLIPTDPAVKKTVTGVTEQSAKQILNKAMSKSTSAKGTDTFIRDYVTPEVLKYATPDQKAHMLKQLMDGKTTKADEEAMLMILKSVGTAGEMRAVISKAGGTDKVLNELESQKDALITHLKSEGDTGSRMILDMAKSYGVTHKRSDDFVANYVDERVLQAATPEDRAHMLECLMDGRTTGRDENAMLRILKSAKNPAEVTDLIKRTGGMERMRRELGGKNTKALVNYVKQQGTPGYRAVAQMAAGMDTKSKYSDDFVRDHVDNRVLAQSTPAEKVIMLEHCLEGNTDKCDEKAILRILDSAKDNEELKAMVNGAGKNWLAKDVDHSKIRKAVESKIFQVESYEAPKFNKLDPTESEGVVDKELEELETFLKDRKKRYDGLSADYPKLYGFWGVPPGYRGPDKSDNFNRFYGELSNTVKEDLKELKDWKSLSREKKIELYNRIAHEASVELKHNVNLTYGKEDGAYWSEKELTDIDDGLSKLPPALGLENKKLYNIRRFKEIIDSDGDKVFAWAKGNGDIEFTDRGVAANYRLTGKGVSPVAETILHEVGHHFDDENPEWKAWMKISGWNDLGSDEAKGLAKFKDGKTYTGKELGLDDETGSYVVSRKYGRTYVYNKNANFMGNYAKTNPKDDFSESLMQYFYNTADFKAKAPEKFKFMDEFVKSLS